MNYSELTAVCRKKVSGYTKNQCDFAVGDIHTTLRFVSGDMSDPYVIKLYAELDAVRDRQMALNKDTLEGRSHIRSNGQPLDTED
jgi:hypothetical protein